VKTILVIDIGNTSTAFGLYRGGRISGMSRLPTRPGDPAAIARAVGRLVKGRRVAGTAISSVVPALNRRWESALRALGLGAPLWVNHRLRLGIPVTYPKPRTIGADRLANAAGAARRYGLPAIVADFGTALTFDVILPREGYVGGVILPGLPLMFDYFAEKTALLPHIRPAAVHRIVGKSTEEAMRIGALWGYRGMVREVVLQIRKALGLKRVVLCATGGHARWVTRGLKPAMKCDDNLTLCGIGLIHELNRP
jgi:type III pantothenate kinase